MSSAPVLVVAPAREALLWEDALRGRNLEPTQVDRGSARKQAARQAPAVVVVSEKLPFMGGLRVIRELRRDPATREAPIVLVGVQPLTTTQRLRLGASAPDATVPRGASAEAVADAAAEAARRGKSPPVELTPVQQAGMKYTRLGTVLMMMGVFLSLPVQRAGGQSTDQSWFLLLIPFGGLVTDYAAGRVDGRKELLSWQGWAAIGFMVVIALGIVFLPQFFRL
jgi:CheY-like chemotaxis protein